MPPRKGSAKFTHQLIVMLDDEMAERIDADAISSRISKSEVARTYMQAGMDRADELEAELEEVSGLL
jgi:hypothetical protein